MIEKLLHLLGNVPNDKGNDFKHRRRLHQGWWRLAVLLEEAGEHPTRKGDTVCNTFRLTDQNRTKNYLSPQAVEVVATELVQRQTGPTRGMIQEPRIWNNLLSSQPLCFNFWGPLKADLALANALLCQLIPDFQELTAISFECEPERGSNLSDDNSAYDVMLEYCDTFTKPVILGFECKYTDQLESKPYDKLAYSQIFEAASHIFARPYEFYVQPAYNQLFRNQLMACAYEQKTGIYTYAGLFCDQQDGDALRVGYEFQASLQREGKSFLVLTYQQFIAALQKLDLPWETRVWTMMLWARYLGFPLSEAISTAHYSR